MKGRNLLSYGLMGFGIIALLSAPLVQGVASPLMPACLALAVMFFGLGWLAMAPENDTGVGRPMRVFFGRLLLSAGVLIALLCGGCTVFFWAQAIPSALKPAHYPDHYFHWPTSLADAILTPLILGGIPVLIGVGVLFLGRWLIRSYRKKAGA